MKKLTSFIICIVLLFSFFCLPSNASEAEGGNAVLSISNATGVPGDTIYINIDMVENPGIMAMTFSVSYDKAAVEFKKYTLGKWNDYTIVDHPEEGYVKFVNGENRNRTYTGTIFTLEFKIKPKATPTLHPFKIMNIHPEDYGEDLTGCFANKAHTKITATVNQGGVTVGESCSNSSNVSHKYGEYFVSVKPTCTSKGIETKACKNCGHTQNREIPKAEHKFSDEWIIDQEATKELSGIMSRHCENCSQVTDKVYFSFEETQSEENTIKNEPQEVVTPESFPKLEEIVKQNNKKPSENGGQIIEEITEKLTEDAEGEIKEQLSKAEEFKSYLFGTEENEGFFSLLFEKIKEFNPLKVIFDRIKEIFK